MRSILRRFRLLVCLAPLSVTACRLRHAPWCAATEGLSATGQSAIAWEAVPGSPGLRGRVVALGSQASIPGAQVVLRHRASRAFTDSLGMAALSYTSGVDTLEVLAMGHYRASVTVVLPRDSSIVFRATMARVPPQISYDVACPP